MRQEPERQARFVDLVHAHQGAIRKVAALYARDSADREDLFQEIVLQLWRSFESFRGDAAFSTFLYRVALNTALMRLRRSYRRPEIEAGRALDDLPAPPRPRSAATGRSSGSTPRSGSSARSIARSCCWCSRSAATRRSPP